MTALKTPLAHTTIFAVYGVGDNHDRLPIIGLDDRDRPLVLSAKGEVVLAKKTRVHGEPFREVVVLP